MLNSNKSANDPHIYFSISESHKSQNETILSKELETNLELYELDVCKYEIEGRNPDSPLAQYVNYSLSRLDYSLEILTRHPESIWDEVIKRISIASGRKKGIIAGRFDFIRQKLIVEAELRQWDRYIQQETSFCPVHGVTQYDDIVFLIKSTFGLSIQARALILSKMANHLSVPASYMQQWADEMMAEEVAQ